jgi:hypothetical protein
MATAGLSFANPFLSKVNVGEQPNPYAPFSPTSSIGAGGLGPSAADMAITGQQLVRQSQFTMPEMVAPPDIAYSPSRKQLYVQGQVFDEDDASTALQTEGLLAQPGRGLPDGDWTPLTADEYSVFLQSIKDPSRGRLFRKGFQTGLQQLKQLYGGALQLAGAEETGGGIVESAEREIQKRAPFQRQFTDVESAGQLVDWFVANLGQQGPMLLESIALGAAGAVGGTATAGPGLGTAGGFVAGVFGKKQFKDKVLDAAAKYRAGQITKDSAEFALLRNASAVAGATAANFAGSYTLGAGDIYNEMREQGVDVDDMGARLTALAGAFPYAAAEMLPEFVLAGRVLGNVGAPRALGPQATRGQRAGELLRRGAVGTGIGGALEGTTELAQEGLVMGLSGQDLTSDEALKRFINAFAAGAAVGGPIGGIANLRGGTTQEVNLLDTTGKTETERDTSTRAPLAPEGQMELPLEGGMVALPQTEFAPGAQVGSQGVLDVGLPGQPLSPQEVAVRQQGLPAAPVEDTRTMQQAELFPAEQQPQGQQMEMDLSPPAPTGIGFTEQQPVPNTLMAQQMQIAQQRQQAEQMRQQRAAQEAAEIERQQNLMLAEQQVQIAEQARIDQRNQARENLLRGMPTRQAGPVQPQQLELFNRREAPRPSRAEGLRRGVGTALPAAQADIPLTAVQRRAQIPLFTQEGQPSVAALKSVATPQPVAAPVEEKGAKVAKPTSKKVTPASVAKAKAEAAQKETERKEKTKKGVEKLKAKAKDMEKADAVQKPSPASVDVQKQPADGKGVRVEDTKGREAPRKAAALKKGKAKAAPQADKVTTPDREYAEQVLAQYNALTEAQRGAVAEELGLTRAEVIKTEAAFERTEEMDDAIAAVRRRPVKLSAEEQWNDKRMFGDVAYADIPQSAKDAWEKSERSDAAHIVILEQIADDVLPMSDTERFNYNMALADEAIRVGDNDKLMDAMSDPGGVVETAFFTDRTRGARDRVNEAQAFLESANLSDAQREVVADAFVMLAEGQRLEAYTQGVISPWYALAKNTTGMLQRLAKVDTVFLGVPQAEAQVLLDRGLITTRNLPASTVKALTKPATTPEQDAGSTPKLSPAVKLADKINGLNKSPVKSNATGRAKIIDDLTRLWKEVRDANLDTTEQDALLGKPLAAFFDKSGKPITNVIDGSLRVSDKKMTAAEIKAIEDIAREERRAAAQRQAEADERSFLDDWTDDVDSGRYMTADGRAIAAPMVIGRVRLAVNKFLSRLTVKPRVFVFKNQADLKAKSPELYRRAAAARPQGDFDTAKAVGYSFGENNVIIFTDRIATEDQLNFVLAHETLGHFGLRSLIPAKQFNALMESVYDQSQAVRDGSDAAMQTRGLSKAEAVEEYLADFAAELDVSLVARIFNAIKGMLNKLGVKFADDAARYWVNQSRRYVRNGDTAAFFNARAVASRINALEGGLDPDGTGRFALTGTLRADNAAVDLMPDTTGGMPESLAEAGKRVRDAVGDSFDSAEKFKAKFFSLLNYRARENAGLAELDRILRAGRGFSMSVKNAANEKMAVVLNRAVASSVAGWKGVGGITEGQITQLNKMLYDAQRFAVAKLKPADIGKAPLFNIAPDGTVTPNTAELDRVFALGALTFDQAKNGYSYEVTYPEAGKDVTETVNVPGIADLDENGPVWQGYLRTRETLRDVEIQLLRARYAAYTQDRDIAFREIGELTTDKKLTATDQKFLEKMYRKYRDLWTADPLTDENGNPAYNPKSLEEANDFIVAFNAALLGRGTDRNAEVAKFFEGAAADDAVAGINEFKKRVVLDDDNKFTIQNKLKDIIIAEVSNDGADIYTKTTLATGYVPVLREGQFQVRVLATNRAGKVVRLKQGYKEQLVYSQTATNSEARNLSDKINGLFGDKTYQVEAYNEDTRTYELMDVRLNAVPEAAITEIAAPPDLNLNEFVRGLRQFSIALNPQKLEEVVVALTRQNSSARNRLKRAFTPGASPDALKAMTQHIESRASTAAKIMMRPKINELMNLNLSTTQKLWNGDEAKLNQLKRNYEVAMADPNASETERLAAKRELDLYNFQYQKTNPVGESGRGNMYYNEAASTLSFLDNNRSVEESDFGSGAVASNVRAYTSMLQLGGSIATGALNYIGAITNGIPYLATYNSKTAFGGGFGLGRSLAEFQRALSQVGLIRSLPGVGERGLNTAEFYDDMAKKPDMLKKYGLTEAEARFMAREIREGEMIPAQSNALVSSARGRVTVGAGQKAIDGFMWTFNVTEQAARRGLGLAAYRMQYARNIAAGMTEADAVASARDFAVNTLRYTVGDYSVMNRPSAWRSGIQSFIYMYKVFPTTSIQLLSRLPRSGQLYMLGALWLMAGVAGLPFVEDAEDLIDTIAQGLGLKMGSVRAELAKTIDSIVPGASPFFLRGMANAYFGGNIADRVSLSDFIPGTGILLSGADVGRELTEIAGPAASMLTGVATFLPRLTQAAFTERVTLVDAMRESPATMMRALGDAFAYGSAGAVVDKRGYVVSPDMNAGLILTRLAGFYPAAAAQQYQIIMASKRITDYQKDTVAGFRSAWIKAKINGDEDQARAIVDAVRDWNEGTKGTALEIKKFLPNSQRALREARRPAQERLLRGAPRAARDDLEAIADLLGYND